MRTLLGSTPVRLPFDVVVGYNSEKGRILEAHLPQSGGGHGSGVQNSPLAGSGARTHRSSPRPSRSAGTSVR